MNNSIRPGIDRPSHAHTGMRFALIGCLLVAGCVTAPLKTQDQRNNLIESIGYRPSEVALIDYCFFESIHELNSERRTGGIRGIVVMTDSEICLMDGAMGMVPTKHFLRIPISEIEGVNSSADQVQIRYEDETFVLVAFNWSDFRANLGLTNRIYETLIAANVPEFETSEFYSWSRLSSSSRRSQRSGGDSRDYPPTNLESSLQRIMGDQAAKDRETERIFGR